MYGRPRAPKPVTPAIRVATERAPYFGKLFPRRLGICEDRLGRFDWRIGLSLYHGPAPARLHELFCRRSCARGLSFANDVFSSCASLASNAAMRAAAYLAAPVASRLLVRNVVIVV